MVRGPVSAVSRHRDATRRDRPDACKSLVRDVDPVIDCVLRSAQPKSDRTHEPHFADHLTLQRRVDEQEEMWVL